MSTGQRGGWVVVTLLCIGAAALALVVAATDSGRSAEVASSAPAPRPRAPLQDQVRSSSLQLDAEQLEVRFRLPARTLAGNIQQFQLEVTGAGGAQLDDDVLLEIRIHPDLADHARGHVWVVPSQLLVPAVELRSRHLELQSNPGLSCDTEPGSLRIEVRTLHLDGPQGEGVAAIPPWPCGLEPPPRAPASVHVDTPVCGERWRQDLETLIAGGSPPSRWCRPSPDRDGSEDSAATRSQTTRDDSPPPDDGEADDDHAEDGEHEDDDHAEHEDDDHAEHEDDDHAEDADDDHAEDADDDHAEDGDDEHDEHEDDDHEDDDHEDDDH